MRRPCWVRYPARDYPDSEIPGRTPRPIREPRRTTISDSTIHYAAYGSNLHPLRLLARIPSARPLGKAAVAGFGLRFHKRSIDGSSKCNAFPGGGVLHVAVYALDAAGKSRLDEIEGVGQGYTDECIEVPGFGVCAIYLAEPHYIDESMQPYHWYRDLVVAGCRYHGFDDRYRRSVASVESRPDPDADRRKRNERLLRAMDGA